MSVSTKPIAAALNVHYKVQDIAARNIANLGTPGFKRVLADVTSATDTDGGSKVQTPQIQGIKLDLSQGSLKLTNNTFDLGIKGDAFFTIDTKNGLRYTRNGAFQLDYDRILCTQQTDKNIQRNDRVLGTNGEIQIPQNAKEIVITRKGEIIVDGVKTATLRLTRFEKGSRDQLRQAGGSLYIGDNANPQDVNPGDPKAMVYQGHLEQSNVNSITELVEMIASYREYEACARSLRAIEETAGQLYAWARS